IGTSDDAELALRSSALTALVNVADLDNREALLQLALNGELMRGQAVFIRAAAAQSFAMLSQPGDLVRYDELLSATEDPTTLAELQNYRAPIEIVAEGCAHDLACLTGLLSHENFLVREKAIFDLARFVDNPAAGGAALLDGLSTVPAQSRDALFRQLRHATLPQTAGETVDNLLEELSGPSNRDLRHLLKMLRETDIE
ncbi:MAG: hypothetical protein KC561_17565, partial [Myxococcales bacterium]|nr:hypothetical protein [Myxococcales bacterium]